MAEQKETIIFEFEVDQGDALNDLERFKRSIIQTKEEQKTLNDAYKKGSITLEEYASDSVRLEQILKKETATYNELSKKVTGHKTATDKLIESNNKLAKSNDDLSGKFQNVAGNINVAGTNLGSLTSGMGAFLNPATAAASIVGTLATAYFNSGRGAQDLERIQFTLQATTEVLSEKVADLVDLLSEEGGVTSGFFNSLADAVPGVKALAAVWGSTVGKQVADLTEIKSKLDDLNQSFTDARVTQTNLLEDNAGLLEEINREATSYNDKIFLAGKMIDNIRQGSDSVLAIRREELELLEKELELKPQSEALERAIAAKKLEIAQEERKAEKLVTTVLKLQDNINAQEDARLEKVRERVALEQQALEHQQQVIDLNTQVVDSQTAINEATVANNEAISASLQNMTLNTDALSKSISEKNKKTEDDIKASNAAIKADRDRVGSTLVLSNAIGGAATIFEKHTIASKVLSAAQAGINSFLAGTEVLKDPSFIGRPVQRIVAMVTTVAAGLAQQGKILGAFAGGGDFVTKGPTWLLVGDNPGGREHVSVKPLSGKGQTRIFNDGAAMAGGGTINGSILAASKTNPIDAQMGLESALSEPSVVNFVETDYSRFKQKITFKEQLTEA